MRSSNPRRAALFGCAALWMTVLASSRSGHAQPALPEVTLRDALRHARADAPAVAAAAAAYALREAEIGAARGAYLPVLTVQGTSGIAYDNRLVAPGTPRIDSESLTSQADLTMRWAALDMARGARVDAAEEAARAQGFSERSVQSNAMLLAAELYVRAAAAAALTKDAELSLERRTQQQRAVAELVQAGTRSPLDVERAKIETLSAQYAVAVSRNDELATGAALAAAMGKPATQPVRAGSDALHALEFELSPELAMSAARGSRPELASQVALVDARREEYAAAVGARLPTVGILAAGTVSYLDVRHGLGVEGHQYGGSALLYVRWTGLDPTVWAQADVAGAAVAEAQGTLVEREHAVEADAVAAAHAVQRAKIQFERAVAILREAEVTREAQNGRYRTGVASMLELLDAENLEQQARRQRIEAERDYRIASAHLLWAGGRLDALAR